MRIDIRLALFFILCVVAPIAQASTSGPIFLDTTYKDTNAGLYLKFTLRYGGNRRYEIFQGDLPWGSQGSIKLHISVKGKHKKALRELGYIADAGPLTIELMPNHTYSGGINLSGMFEGIDDIHKRYDLVVKWSYQLTTVGGYSFNQINGYLFIPKLQIDRQSK